MSTGYPMKCRYSPDHHGTFSNAVALRKHYDSQHEHEFVPANQTRVTCNACGAPLLLASFPSHKNVRHEGKATYTIVGTTVPKKVVKALVPVPGTPAPSRPAERHTAPDPVLHEPLSADDIVLTTIELMSQPGNVVPVAHLAALFAWRDATAVMLREVSGQ
jgi:hypothetical protein